MAVACQKDVSEIPSILSPDCRIYASQAREPTRQGHERSKFHDRLCPGKAPRTFQMQGKAIQ